MKMIVAALLLVELGIAGWPMLQETHTPTATADLSNARTTTKGPRCEDVVADVLRVLAGDLK